MTKRVPRTAHDLSASSRGSASRVRTRLRPRVFHTRKPFHGKHAWGAPQIARLDNLPGRIGASSPSACSGSDPPSAPNNPHSRRHCPDQDVAVRAGKDRLCRIRSAGAGTRTRFKPAPWKVREGRVAGQPSVQSACARDCACKRWVGGRSLHHLGPEKGTSTADSPSHLSPEAGAYSLQARDRPGEP